MEDIFTLEKVSDKYQIKISDNIKKYIKTPMSGSWNVLGARLFGLDYDDYLRMVRDRYDGILKGKNTGYIYYLLKNKDKGETLCNELNLRFVKDLQVRAISIALTCIY